MRAPARGGEPDSAHAPSNGQLLLLFIRNGSGLSGGILRIAGRQLDFIVRLAIDFHEGYHAGFDRYSNRVSWELVARRGLHLIEQVMPNGISVKLALPFSPVDWPPV